MADNNRQDEQLTVSQAWNRGMQIGYELNAAKRAMRETIAKRIKGCRMEMKLTQEQLSSQISINHLTYRGYENCKSDIPIVYLIRLADVFGVSLDYLTGRTESKTGTPEPAAAPSMEARLQQLEKAIAELTEQSKPE